MANSDKNIKITPNISQTAQPNVVFTGQGNVPITLKVLDDSFGTLSFEGSAGQLFSINNNLSTGVIFSVNDISGIPQIDVNADGTVRLVPFGGVVGVGTSTALTGILTPLHVNAVSSYGSILSSQATATVVADSGGELQFAATYRTTFGGGDLTQVARIRGLRENTTSNNWAGYLAFYTSTGSDSPSASTERMRINSSGNVGIGTVSPGARLQVDTGASTTKGLIVKGFTSQSANLQEWQNSAGTVLTTVDSAGKVAIGTTSTTVKLNVQTASNTIGTGLSYYYTSYALTSSATTTYANDFFTYGDRGSSNATLWGMRVAHNGANTGTTVGTNYTRGALLVQCQDYNEGTGSTFGIKIENIYGSASNAYGLYAENTTAVAGNSYAGYFSALAAGSTAYGIFAKAENPAGIRSATAGEFYISNSVTSNAYGIKVSNAEAITVAGVYYGCHVSISGATVTAAKAAGFFSDGTYTATFGNGSYSALFNSSVGIVSTTPGGRLQIDTGAAATKGLIVKGFTSQSANLTEWQDSSSTVVASINPSGKFTCTGFSLWNTTSTQVLSATSGYATLGADLDFNGTSARNIGSAFASGYAQWTVINPKLQWPNNSPTSAIENGSVGQIKVTNGSTGGGSFAFAANTTSISTNTNDLVLNGSAFQRLNCTLACTLTGVAPPSAGSHVEGRMIRLYNVGTASLTLAHASASSTSGNRFYSVSGASIVLAPSDYAELIYDSSATAATGGTAGWRLA